MKIRDAHEGRFPSREIGNQYGAKMGEVELSSVEVYEAIARAAVEKFLGLKKDTPLTRREIEVRLPEYSVSVFPDVLARHVVLGRGISAELFDGWSEVVLHLLPEDRG